MALLQSQALRILVLRNFRIARFVGDVGAVTAVQHLNPGGGKIQDQPVGVGDFLVADDFECALGRDFVRVVGLERYILGTIFHIGAKTADVGRDLPAVGGVSELARQFEQLHRLRVRDGVHLLTRPEAGEARLVRVVLGADLHERTEPPHAHTHRFAAGGVRP